MHKARLHPKWTRSGYRYTVLFNGRLLLKNSRDPELDAARALVAMGLTGKLTICDGKTGRPRSIIPDIEEAAGFRMSEEDRDGLRLRRYVNPDIALPAAEKGLTGGNVHRPSEEAA